MYPEIQTHLDVGDSILKDQQLTTPKRQPTVAAAPVLINKHKEAWQKQS